MSHHPTCRLALAVLLSAIALPSLTRAQEPATSLTDLQQWVRIGDVVTVTDVNGHKVTGRVGGLKDDALSLVRESAGRDDVRWYRRDDVQAITRRETDSLRNGALIGFGVGAGLFLLAVASDGCPYDSNNCAGLILVGTGFYGAMGAGIGVGVDALVPGPERVIYRRSAGHTTLGVAPHLAPQRQAVIFSVGF